MENSEKPKNEPVFNVDENKDDACSVASAIGDGLLFFLPILARMSSQKDTGNMLRYVETTAREMRLAYEQSRNCMELIENPDVMEKHNIADMGKSLPSADQLHKRAHATLVSLAVGIITTEVSNPLMVMESIETIVPEVSERLNDIKEKNGGSIPDSMRGNLFCTADVTDDGRIAVKVNILKEESKPELKRRSDGLWKALDEIKERHQ